MERRWPALTHAATRAAKRMQNARQRKQAMRANVGTELVLRPPGLAGSKLFPGGIDYLESVQRLRAMYPNAVNATNTRGTKRQRTQ